MKVSLVPIPLRPLSFLFSLLLLPISQTSAAVLTSYNLNTITNPGASGSSAATTTFANTTSNALGTALFKGTASSVTMNNGVAGTSAAMIGTGSGPSTSTNSITNNKYWEFTITPAALHELDLTNLTLQVQHTDAAGATNIFLMSNLDGFASTTDILFDSGAGVQTTGSFTTVTWAFNTLGVGFDDYQDLASAVTFRIYGYGSTSTTAAARFDSVTLNGTVVSVPEPSAYALLFGGMGMLLGFRRLSGARLERLF